jgi:hypothetical protein
MSFNATQTYMTTVVFSQMKYKNLLPEMPTMKKATEMEFYRLQTGL